MFNARTFPWLVIVLLAGAALLWAAAGRAQEEPAPEPDDGVTVAVLEMSTVLAESERWQDGVNERRRLADRMTRALEKTDQHLQLLRNERENLPPDTDERRQKEQEIRQALQEREQKRREFEEEVTQHYDAAIRALLKDLNRAVNEYVAEHDVDLVLKKQSLELTDRENPQLLLATADVLYAAADLDISRQIVRRLNTGYAGPIEVK